uniref:Uncharacterized protein n=1 Tax=Anguilla anguilla TaxID=7936 RepID=A0A0E9SLV4_ANGAN
MLIGDLVSVPDSEITVEYSMVDTTLCIQVFSFKLLN